MCAYLRLPPHALWCWSRSLLRCCVRFVFWLCIYLQIYMRWSCCCSLVDYLFVMLRYAASMSVLLHNFCYWLLSPLFIVVDRSALRCVRCSLPRVPRSFIVAPFVSVVVVCCFLHCWCWSLYVIIVVLLLLLRCWLLLLCVLCCCFTCVVVVLCCCCYCYVNFVDITLYKYYCCIILSFCCCVCTVVVMLFDVCCVSLLLCCIFHLCVLLFSSVSLCCCYCVVVLMRFSVVVVLLLSRSAVLLLPHAIDRFFQIVFCVCFRWSFVLRLARLRCCWYAFQMPFVTCYDQCCDLHWSLLIPRCSFYSAVSLSVTTWWSMRCCLLFVFVVMVFRLRCYIVLSDYRFSCCIVRSLLLYYYLLFLISLLFCYIFYSLLYYYSLSVIIIIMIHISLDDRYIYASLWLRSLLFDDHFVPRYYAFRCRSLSLLFDVCCCARSGGIVVVVVVVTVTIALFLSLSFVTFLIFCTVICWSVFRRFSAFLW